MIILFLLTANSGIISFIIKNYDLLSQEIKVKNNEIRYI
jgi:hypothetical protein